MESREQWATGRTLGCRASAFWWRADELGNLTFRCKQRTGQLHAAKGRLAERAELEALLEWLSQREWVLLECMPAKLRDGSAREGLGKFLHERLHWPAVDAVFASHIAAVLTAAEVVTWNGKKRGMAFRLVSRDLGRVRALFERSRAAAKPAARPQRKRAVEPGGAEPPQFVMCERFRARSRELRARFDASGGGHHPVEKGWRREAALRAFLREELPGRYGIASGEVVAATGEASGQVDVLVVDEQASPLLDAAEGSVLVAAETACAAIEVKPLLNRATLAEAVANLRSVKALPRLAIVRPEGVGGAEGNPPPFTAVFGFGSVGPQRVLRLLAELEGDGGSALEVDCVCMLDRGVVFRHPGLWGPPGMVAPAARPRGRGVLVCHEAGEDSLLAFHLLLERALTARRAAAVDLSSYAWGLRLGERSVL